jgi:hypothetical protein
MAKHDDNPEDESCRFVATLAAGMEHMIEYVSEHGGPEAQANVMFCRRLLNVIVGQHRDLSAEQFQRFWLEFGSDIPGTFVPSKFPILGTRADQQACLRCAFDSEQIDPVSPRDEDCDFLLRTRCCGRTVRAPYALALLHVVRSRLDCGAAVEWRPEAVGPGESGHLAALQISLKPIEGSAFSCFTVFAFSTPGDVSIGGAELNASYWLDGETEDGGETEYEFEPMEGDFEVDAIVVTINDCLKLHPALFSMKQNGES